MVDDDDEAILVFQGEGFPGLACRREGSRHGYIQPCLASCARELLKIQWLKQSLAGLDHKDYVWTFWPGRSFPAHCASSV